VGGERAAAAEVGAHEQADAGTGEQPRRPDVRVVEERARDAAREQ
jgi:hypothetical protein